MPRSMNELATQYTVLMSGSSGHPLSVKNEEAWSILNEMQMRVGAENTNTYLAQAREVYKLLVPD